MTNAEIKILTEWLKNNCDAFIDQIHDYMKMTNWNWWDSPDTPTFSRIRTTLFALLDRLTDVEETSTGGICVKKDGNQIICSFGQVNNVVCTLEKSLNEYYNVTSDNVLSFIDYVCAECPGINKDYLIEQYHYWKNEI